MLDGFIKVVPVTIIPVSQIGDPNSIEKPKVNNGKNKPANPKLSME